MGTIDVVHAAPDRWADVQIMLGGDGDRGCWCQSWRGTAGAARALDETRPETVRRQMADGPPEPGFLAYLDGAVVGWAGVSVRSKTPRLVGSRTIPAIDDSPIWSIGCLRVRVGHRRRGVTGALLAGVVEAARVAGAPGLEAYPIDPGGRRVNASFAFVGIASTFERAGFRRVLETRAHSAGLPRQLVRLDFDRP